MSNQLKVQFAHAGSAQYPQALYENRAHGHNKINKNGTHNYLCNKRSKDKGLCKGSLTIRLPDTVTYYKPHTCQPLSDSEIAVSFLTFLYNLVIILLITK